MKNNKSVFEYLDSLQQHSSTTIAQNEEILILLKDIKSKSVQQQASVKAQMSEQEVLKKFVKASQKEYLWFGTHSDFNKSKRLLNIICILLITVAIISTILTSKAIKLYSTFTFFENIWTILVGVILSYSIHAEKRMTDVNLMKHSCDIYMQDEDGTWREMNKEKKRFKWFRRISYIAAIANIIVLLTSLSGALAVAAIIFELAFLGLSIAVYFVVINLYCMYGNIILFTGRNTSNNATVTIVFDVIGKQLYPLEEFQQKYELLFE